MGWRFKQSSWGQGYATEAASALCNALKMQPEIKTLSAMALADNKASISVMQSWGLAGSKTIYTLMNKAIWMPFYTQRRYSIQKITCINIDLTFYGMHK
ncbi:GNAT family N-acetyltransferase [Pseudoalteromonas sp. Hal099]